ncbi:MAG: metallophosphoesterase [Planctomycetes bacterium]|nr:metallophosphoesterase [Planctomycetota bacterium]
MYKPDLPGGDLLLFAGDLTHSGSEKQIKEMLEYLDRQPYEYIVMIAGNHDFGFENNSICIRELIPKRIIYLENESCEIEGLNIWGSPYSPWFLDWAFNLARGEAIRKVWNQIPENTDILITHGPPHGVLDQNQNGECCGCEELLGRAHDIRPRLHLFGHIHEGYGSYEEKDLNVIFLNASIESNTSVSNEPICLEWFENIGPVLLA